MRIMKGKYLKERRKLYIKNESRFYALLVVILGIVSGFIFKAIGEIDMTGPIFTVLLGLLSYISTFGEDK